MVTDKKADNYPVYDPGFNHAPPDKAESLLCRLNLSAPDPGSPLGGGTGQGLTPGQIAAAFAMGSVAVPDVECHLGKDVTKLAVYELALYKHTGDGKAYRGIRMIALQLMVSQSVKTGWKPERRGLMTRSAELAVDDVCNPARYANRSARLWARDLGLDSHQDWIRRWRSRYDSLRFSIQSLDHAGEERVRRYI